MQRAQPSNNAGTFTLGRGTHVQNLASDLEAGQLVSILTCPLDIPPHGSRSKENCPGPTIATVRHQALGREACDPWGKNATAITEDKLGLCSFLGEDSKKIRGM
ncbi:hypothetical protein QLX08_009675 [Tetragonisca angustula]|uniref:Uncharacterized protein n=1 Tax=Tetragonisca angustula TaxID=166442 RepID=A0AAW0ZG23_9HYME